MSVSYTPTFPAILQTANWTCSACSLAWMNTSLSIDIATDEWSAVEYIGQPTNINSTWGLMDASGLRLAQCLREQGAPALNAWLDWHSVWLMAEEMPLLIGGVTWNHWSGVRYTAYDYLVLANPAPGWQGIEQTMTESQFNYLGPFAVVAVPLNIQFPPLPETES